MNDDEKKPAPDRPLSRARAALDGAVPEPAPEATPEPSAPPAAADAAAAEDETPAPDPTRYGDWERKGRCIDF